jgi:hypothetical protein
MVAVSSHLFPYRFGEPAGRGVMRTIKGDIGAIRGFTAAVVFSPQGRGSKEGAMGFGFQRMIYPSADEPFT